MAIQFMDGCDYYPNGDIGLKWTSFSNQSISGTTRFGVGQSINLNGVGRIQKTLTAQNTWTIGAAIRHPIIGAAGGTQGSIIDIFSTATLVFALEVDSAGRLYAGAYDNSAVFHQLCIGTTYLRVGVWYYIEVQFVCGATVNVTNITVKINGVTECSFAATSGGNTSAATTANVIRFNGPLNGNYFIDDVYICDGTGSAPYNGFLGEGRIGTQRPAGAGYSTQWTPDTGSNFARVNETTENGDTSYVSTNTATNIDSYTVAALPTTPTSITAVQMNAVAKNDAGSHTFQINTRISSTNYTSSTFTLTASYAIYTQIQALSPATSVTWTTTEVANYEIGLNLIS